MVGHCQVVLQSEGLQHDPVSYRERQAQLVILCRAHTHTKKGVSLLEAVGYSENIVTASGIYMW